jgi:GNAT superfamily N-acetyltransferase
MRVAIAHYHLQTGGVSRVIQHACTALQARGARVVVLSGTAPQVSLPAGTEIAVLKGLDYDERRDSLSPDRLATEMASAASSALGGAPDIWHIHNHSLGKNTALPGALLRLARNEQRLLLQPHDFAEDGRPALYRRLREVLAGGDIGRLSALLYPIAPQIHYAALNQRDRGFLSEVGVPAGQLHLLPNAVSLGLPRSGPPPDLSAPESSTGPRLWLYPTRAIRRKNIGEFLLWAALAADTDRFATTQAPQNPSERPIYEQWVALARELNLPVDFEIGGGDQDFPALLARSHALLTTSVAEGFGLAFLEPWLLERALLGRDLPEITAEFKDSGIALDSLYRSLMVPLDWLDARRLREAFDRAAEARAEAFGRPSRTSRDDAERAWLSAVVDGRIDFGRLDETAQIQVIRRLKDGSADPGQLIPPALPERPTTAVIAANRDAVDAEYSLRGFGERLMRVYAEVASASPGATYEAASGERLLDQFLAPERLSLLRG